MTDYYNPDHFAVVDGELTPQPWMQHRHVGSIAADSLFRNYSVTVSGGGFFGLGSISDMLGGLVGGISSLFGGFFGGLVPDPAAADATANKNDLLHSLALGFTNDSPIDQYCYGLITRGGCRVALQARSRGYLVVASSYGVGGSAGTLDISSVMGCGADMGRAGILAIGTTFCVLEQRQNTLTFPLAPERTGWCRLAPGERFNAKVEVRFISEEWETSMIDGGATEAESSIDTGDTRLDLYALPVIE